MQLGCNVAADKIRIDRYRQPLLFKEQIADDGRPFGRLGWMVGWATAAIDRVADFSD